MANLRIQVIAPPANEYISKGNGKGYNKLTVTFKNLATNKIEVKNIMDFASPDVYAKLKSVGANEAFQITSEKQGDYWVWTEVHRDDGAVPEAVETPKAASGAPAKSNTYEVNNQIQQQRLKFDEEKQPLIIRQSCLSSAVTLGVANKMGSDAILQIAEQFEQWVNRKDPQTPEFNDIPT